MRLKLKQYAEKGADILLSEEFFVMVTGGFQFDVTANSAKKNQQIGKKKNGEVQNNELKEIPGSNNTNL